MNKVYTLEREFVEKLQKSEADYAVLKDLLQGLAEQRMENGDQGFMDSEAYTALLKKASKAKIRYETMKGLVQTMHVDKHPVDGYIAQSWSLDYDTCNLTITYTKI